MFLRRFVLILSAFLTLSTLSLAQKADASFVVGGSFVSDGKVNTGIICITAPCPSVVTFRTDHQYFLEATGAVRLVNFKVASLHLEIPVAAIPSALVVRPNFTLSSLYVTPSLRVKLAPGFPVSPFVSVGGGWAHYHLPGAGTNGGALQFGGGVDLKTGIPLLGIRGEVRDFVTGQPNFKSFFGFPTQNNDDLRHNVLVGGGIVLRF
jgi:hypothetical protein